MTNNGLLKPFSILLDLVAKHGYLRSLFAFALLAVFVAVPIYFVLPDDPASEDTAVVPPSTAEIGSEITNILFRIRVGLGADVVWLSEHFTTATGNVRGFDPDGSYENNYISRSAAAPRDAAVMGQRLRLGPSATDPEGYISRQLEIWEREGFRIDPDTSIDPLVVALPGLRVLIGQSYYAIVGYDLNMRMIVVVQISFFQELTVLDEDDLRPYVDDVQRMVALLLN